MTGSKQQLKFMRATVICRKEKGFNLQKKLLKIRCETSFNFLPVKTSWKLSVPHSQAVDITSWTWTVLCWCERGWNMWWRWGGWGEWWCWPGGSSWSGLSKSSAWRQLLASGWFWCSSPRWWGVGSRRRRCRPGAGGMGLTESHQSWSIPCRCVSPGSSAASYETAGGRSAVKPESRSGSRPFGPPLCCVNTGAGGDEPWPGTDQGWCRSWKQYLLDIKSYFIL